MTDDTPTEADQEKPEEEKRGNNGTRAPDDSEPTPAAKDPNRNADGTFAPGNTFAVKPGEVRNPHGRPKGRKLRDILDSLLQQGAEPDWIAKERDKLGLPDDATVAEVFVASNLKAAISDASARIVKEIWERMDGKVDTNVRVRIDEATDLEELSDSQLEEVLRREEMQMAARRLLEETEDGEADADESA
jgi:hypothetical protein